MRDACDAVDLHALRAHRLVGKFDGVLRDVDGVIAHSLEIRCYFEHRRNFAQFARHGLLPPDQLDTVRFDAAPEIVDDVVSRDDSRSRSRIAIIERIDRDANRVAHERAEPHDVEPRRFQCLVIRRPNCHRCLPSIPSPSWSEGTSAGSNERTCSLYQSLRLTHAI